MKKIFILSFVFLLSNHILIADEGDYAIRDVEVFQTQGFNIIREIGWYICGGVFNSNDAPRNGIGGTDGRVYAFAFDRFSRDDSLSTDLANIIKRDRESNGIDTVEVTLLEHDRREISAAVRALLGHSEIEEADTSALLSAALSLVASDRSYFLEIFKGTLRGTVNGQDYRGNLIAVFDHETAEMIVITQGTTQTP